MLEKITLKNGKIQYYYKGQLIRTSNRDYKYCLVKENERGIWAMKFSNSIETIQSFFNYLTKGYGREFAGSGLWSDQFNNPKELHIIK